MNRFKKLSKSFTGKDKAKNLVISIVILIEVIAILMVASFAWVETVSSIKITNKDDEAIVDSYVFTRAMIGNKAGTIDLGRYFKQGGDMHLSPASSADGRTMYFPQKADATSYSSGAFRKGNINDKNTVYMSATFKLRVDTNADFFFTEVPTFSSNGNDIRVSITAYSEGSDPNTHLDSDGNEVSNTRIYALNSSNTAVVNSTTGATGATKVEAFQDHDIEGRTSSARLFSVGAEETYIVTVNLWLQGTSMSSNLSTNIDISHFGLKSDLTPRHVTLIPTPTWDKSNITEYFYAWCWMSDESVASRLYKLELDENEHYSFDYNGKYDNTLFIRSGNAELTKDYLASHWNDNTVWNKTEDTAIPVSPVDPTYIIKTENGSTEHDDSHDSPTYDNNAKKSTGEWSNPVKINLAYTTSPANQDAMGTLAATTYIGTSTSTHVMEQTNSSSQKHQNLIHGWTGKRLKLSATAKTVSGNAQYVFEGWYSSADGAAANRLSTNANYDFNITASAGSEVTYFAKFKEVRKITLNKYLDGSSSTASIGTFKIDSDTTGSGTTSSINKTVDKDSTVTLSATPATGYSVEGFYNVQTAGTALSPMTTSGTTKSVTITANSANFNTNYYVRFTSNEHNVIAHARYSTDNGSTYSGADSTTGGTVKVGTAAAGSSSEATVKYKKTVTLTASPASGYEFVGWYSNTTGTPLSGSYTSTTYTYTLNNDSDVNVYARFKYAVFNVTARAYYTTDGTNYTANNSTGGTVKAGSANAGATSTDSVQTGSTITLVADPASGYSFEGWYTAASGGTNLSTSTTYNYTMSSYSDISVYARFKKMDTVYLKGDFNSWGTGNEMTPNSSGIYSCTVTNVPEGGFKFKLYNDTTATWYGKDSTTVTETGAVSSLSSTGGNITFNAHAGSYTFTYNKANNSLTITRNKYNNITITFDYSGFESAGADDAVIYMYYGDGDIAMTMDRTNKKATLSIPSNKANSGNVGFNRKKSDGSVTWNNWTPSEYRGYHTKYSASGWGTGSWS